ncbi:hypothetical protein RBB50_004456 [Rhinocladiella similis]
MKTSAKIRRFRPAVVLMKSYSGLARQTPTLALVYAISQSQAAGGKGSNIATAVARVLQELELLHPAAPRWIYPLELLCRLYGLGRKPRIRREHTDLQLWKHEQCLRPGKRTLQLAKRPEPIFDCHDCLMQPRYSGITGNTAAAEGAFVATGAALDGFGALTGLDELVGAAGLLYQAACAVNTYVGPVASALGAAITAYELEDCPSVSRRSTTSLPRMDSGLGNFEMTRRQASSDNVCAQFLGYFPFDYNGLASMSTVCSQVWSYDTSQTSDQTIAAAATDLQEFCCRAVLYKFNHQHFIYQSFIYQSFIYQSFIYQSFIYQSFIYQSFIYQSFIYQSFIYQHFIHQYFNWLYELIFNYFPFCYHGVQQHAYHHFHNNFNSSN